MKPIDPVHEPGLRLFGAALERGLQAADAVLLGYCYGKFQWVPSGWRERERFLQRVRFGLSLVAQMPNPHPFTPAMNFFDGQYLFMDRLSLVGVLNQPGARLLTINYYTKASLGMAQFLVMLALFCHGLRKRGHELPIHFDPEAEYVSAKQIVEAIQGYLCSLRHGPSVLVDADEPEIAKIILALRKKLRVLEMNPFLIKTGPGNRKYRLEVAPGNLQLHFVDPDSGEVYDIPWLSER